MAKRQASQPEFDPNVPVDPAQVADTTDTATAVAEDPEESQDEQPTVSPEGIRWRGIDAVLYRVLIDEPRESDFEKLESAGIRSRDELDRELNRVKAIIEKRKDAVSPARLEELDRIATETETRCERERKKEIERFQQLENEHRAKLRAIDAEQQAARNAHSKALAARDGLRRLVPSTVQNVYNMRKVRTKAAHHEAVQLEGAIASMEPTITMPPTLDNLEMVFKQSSHPQSPMFDRQLADCHQAGDARMNRAREVLHRAKEHAKAEVPRMKERLQRLSAQRAAALAKVETIRDCYLPE